MTATTSKNRVKKFPKFKELKGQRVVRDDDYDDNGTSVEQLSCDGAVYHSTKGWRKRGPGFSTVGHAKILMLVNGIRPNIK